MDWSATMLAIGGGHPDAEFPLDGVSLESVLRDPAHDFERPLYWRMNHRGQRALRRGDWKYLKVDEHEYLFNVAVDARERANQAGRQPDLLARLRGDWLAWAGGIPEIPEDAGVSLGYSYRDMPQR